MKRFELTKRLVELAGTNTAIVAGIGNTHFDLWAVDRQRQPNFYMLGSMGLACPIALGVAIAQPDRQVIAIEGDGSLLMEVGCLATIAWKKPANLTIVVMDNSQYQITGGQPTATSAGADLVQMAIAAGLSQSAWAQGESDFEKLVKEGLDGKEPCFIGAHIDDDKPHAVTERDPALLRYRFMQGLGTRS